MNNLWQDIRYGIRMLVKKPGFTAVAIITLALGIGANTAIFSVVNAVLLKPLPYSEPERLVSVSERDTRGDTSNSISYPNFFDWRVQNSVFERLAVYRYNSFTLTDSGMPTKLTGMVVSADLFQLLDATPSLGRNFLPEEERPGGGRAVVLSHGLWQRRFGGDSDVLGRAVTLNGKSFNVVGVMPAGFNFPQRSTPIDVWATLALDAETADGTQSMTANRGAHSLQGVARLKPNVTPDQAQAEMDRIARGLEQQYPDTNKSAGVQLKSLQDSFVSEYRPTLYVLLAAVGCVLLIACANVANLLLARSTARHKEMAVRSALGANRLRIVRQLLTESLLLAFVGGALGLLLASWGTDLLVSLVPEGIPRLSEVAIDKRVLGFSLAISLVTGVIFGLAPALNVSKVDLTEALKEGGRSATDGGRRASVRSTLVVVEVALAGVLLICAGLLMQSFQRLQRVDPGFDVSNTLTARISLPEGKYVAPQQAAGFFEQLTGRVRTLPGVIAASAVSSLPLGGNQFAVSFGIEEQNSNQVAEFRVITPDYFRTMGTALLKGRDFTVRDRLQSPHVVIINETLAKHYFPGVDPVGRRIDLSVSVGGAPSPMREIVGVVRDVKWQRLDQKPTPEAYVPHAQIPFVWFQQVPFYMTLIVRTESDPHRITKALEAEVYALDKDLPLTEVKTLDQYFGAAVAQPRFNALLLALFASVALCLTAVGIYGVMAYSVTQRTHEIGIRMALGAQTDDVLKMVIKQGMVLALIGVVIGLTAAFALTRVMASLLYGVSATDPVTFAGVALLLAVVALLACYIPARRATKVDPMVALRYE